MKRFAQLGVWLLTLLFASSGWASEKTAEEILTQAKALEIRFVGFNSEGRMNGVAAGRRTYYVDWSGGTAEIIDILKSGSVDILEPRAGIYSYTIIPFDDFGGTRVTQPALTWGHEDTEVIRKLIALCEASSVRS